MVLVQLNYLNHMMDKNYYLYGLLSTEIYNPYNPQEGQRRYPHDPSILKHLDSIKLKNLNPQYHLFHKPLNSTKLVLGYSWALYLRVRNHTNLAYLHTIRLSDKWIPFFYKEKLILPYFLRPRKTLESFSKLYLSFLRKYKPLNIKIDWLEFCSPVLLSMLVNFLNAQNKHLVQNHSETQVSGSWRNGVVYLIIRSSIAQQKFNLCLINKKGATWKN